MWDQQQNSVYGNELIGVIYNGEGTGDAILATWDKNGKRSSEESVYPTDLINIPETHEVVVGFYELRVKGARIGVAMSDIDDPPANSGYACIASERITFTENKFAEEDPS